MILSKLKAVNFKLFKESEFDFDSSFNLIIGENGSGKSSLLEAISVALGGWAHAFIKEKENLRPIENEEIREVQIDNSFDKSKKTYVKAIGKAQIIDKFGNRKTGYSNWTRTREEGYNDTVISGGIKYNSYPTEYNLNFNSLGSDILDYIESGKKFDLPLIAFYECNRLWHTQNELNAVSAAKSRFSRFDPYVDCFHTGADHKAIGEWILKHELASNQQRKETSILKSIKSAAQSALENCKDLKFDFEKSRVMVEFEDGVITPFEHLSDGQRTMLGLFCDIARRAAILNPHFEGDASTKTKGVVLIDELDLHLHPKWQRKIISDLKETFPKLQFFCTTHSPFLIQSLNKGSLIQLGEVHTGEFVDSSIEDIVEDVQGVELPQKSKRYHLMMKAAEDYYSKLNEISSNNDETIENLKTKLDELTIPYSDDPAFSAFLKFERDTAKAKLKGN